MCQKAWKSWESLDWADQCSPPTHSVWDGVIGDVDEMVANQ